MLFCFLITAEENYCANSNHIIVIPTSVIDYVAVKPKPRGQRSRQSSRNVQTNVGTTHGPYKQYYYDVEPCRGINIILHTNMWFSQDELSFFSLFSDVDERKRWTDGSDRSRGTGRFVFFSIVIL